jgi:hypothetical protein
MMLLQESAAAIALAAGAEGPEHLKDAEARLKKLDKELQEERQCVLELPPFFVLSRTASFSSYALVADTAALSNSCDHVPRSS